MGRTIVSHYLGSFAAASLTTDHRHLVFPNRPQQFLWKKRKCTTIESHFLSTSLMEWNNKNSKRHAKKRWPPPLQKKSVLKNIFNFVKKKLTKFSDELLKMNYLGNLTKKNHFLTPLAWCAGRRLRNRIISLYAGSICLFANSATNSIFFDSSRT